MQGVASVTADAVGIWGIPALREGNLLQIWNGTGGIDEACSGVRSLQTCIMWGLYPGALFRLPPVKRVLLLPVDSGNGGVGMDLVSLARQRTHDRSLVVNPVAHQ